MIHSMQFFLIVTSLLLLISCGRNKAYNEENQMPELSFPYQVYLDSIGEGEYFPTIGNDGNGFNAISDNIVYPEMPDTLSLSNYADSLLQYYNITLAFNTMAYDVGTAERYMEADDFGLKQADALDSINLSGIKDLHIRNIIKTICHKSASAIRSGKKPNEQDISEISDFYDAFNEFTTPLYAAHLDYSEFDPQDVIDDYDSTHAKVLSDTTSYRSELLNRVLSEPDFQKQCVLARELAYLNHNSIHRENKEIVTILDRLLQSGKYSPLLGDLWRMWRCILQNQILGSRSNDGPMYNLFYNQMKNRIALIYIAYITTHYNDKIAFKEFVRLTSTCNIVRNSRCTVGNNGNIEEWELFD